MKKLGGAARNQSQSPAMEGTEGLKNTKHPVASGGCRRNCEDTTKSEDLGAGQKKRQRKQ